MLNNRLFNWMNGLLKMPLLNNSIWGIISNIFQNILFSIFFIVIARKYSTADFSNYILANTLYSFVLAFSSLGLGQWFVREVVKSEDKGALINRFFKIQLIAGILFYFVNVGLAFVLYDSIMIRNLTLLVGVNLIFDNIIRHHSFFGSFYFPYLILFNNFLCFIDFTVLSCIDILAN